MEKPLYPNDVVLEDAVFLNIGVRPMSSDSLDERVVLDRDEALRALKDNPGLGARLLSVSGNKMIIWAGGNAAAPTGRGSFGARVFTRRDGQYYTGDNVYGRFLGEVRDAYREYLSNLVVQEDPVRDGQVVVDFTRKGALESEVTAAEREADTAPFIHVDAYSPVRFRFDAARDGTTGHARRESDEDVEFHSFVCPFGVDRRAAVRVGSEAEASLLYERALRGELDWEALFTGLRDRGLVSAQVSDRAVTKAIADYKAQFAWMRERICEDPSLRQRTIVASSALVADASMGRSVFDADLAPSPAHVLARYINNPSLLFVPADYSVIRALELPDRDEPQRLSVEGGDGTINVLVIGSDVIGGREPGRKAIMKTYTEERRDGQGRRVVVSVKRPEIPMKSREEQEADYASFKARLDSILSEVPEGVSVRLVTGNASSMGDSVGLGVPRLVERYVRERKGAVESWDFGRREAVPVGEGREAGGRLSALLMEHFSDCMPVLAGRERAVSFSYDNGSPEKDGEAVFSADDLGASVAALCFSDPRDHNYRNILSLGSYASGTMPVIHVQGNQQEEEQAESLREGALLSEAELTGRVEIRQSLFGENPRRAWDLDGVNNLTFVDKATGFTQPLVFDSQLIPVAVGGVRFDNIFAVFDALVAEELGRGGRDFLVSLAANGNSIKGLTDAFGALSADPAYTPDVEERCMVRAVRLMAGSNSAFARRLLELDGRDVVMPCSPAAGRLFVGLDGVGENRFGVVLAAERDRMKTLLETRRAAANAERARVENEYLRMRRDIREARTDGEKVRGGLPRNAKEAEGAVWLLGTATPDGIVLPDGGQSFVQWDDRPMSDSPDPLRRGLVKAPSLPDGEGGQIDNEFVYLFPSNLSAVVGRDRYVNRGDDSPDFTGATRVDPKTGKEFVCAFGVPVKRNSFGNELGNDEDFPHSYRLDNEVKDFISDLVIADSTARAAAFSHGMALCMVGRPRQTGDFYYPLGQVFRDKIYAYNPDSGKKEWVDNPHKSLKNAIVVDRYTDMLERGRYYPLNCIPLAHSDYSYEPGEAHDRNVKFGRFIADLNFALRVADATAKRLGVPLRFPLGPDGRLDLGPGVPEDFRAAAEERVNALIGVVEKEDVTTRALPEISKTAFRYVENMSNTGAQIQLRPNELAAAFGMFDESDRMLAGGERKMPLHRMDFVMKDRDGNDVFFSVRDGQVAQGAKSSDIEASLRYESNERRWFIIHSTNPEMVGEFKAALKGYVERASLLKVETRIVGENDTEARDFSLNGFVDIKPSFEYEDSRLSFKDGVQHSVGRPVDITGAASRLDGSGDVDEYAGKVRATNGFSGYAQIRYTLTNGKQSGWLTIGNDHIDDAKDIIMKMIRRDYPWETGRHVPEQHVLDMKAKAIAVEYAGEEFRKMRYVSPSKHVKEDDKVVSIEREEAAAPVVADPALGEPAAVVPAPERRPEAEVTFTESSGGYSQRTRENANADGVLFTLAFATDYSTAGERCTARAAGDSLIPVDLPLKEKGGLDLSEKAVSAVVARILDEYLPDEFIKGEPCGLNIAGNGIYTLNGSGVTQEQTDEFVTRVLAGLQRSGVEVTLLRSGGQTGADEAGVAAGMALGIPVEVHAPKGYAFRGKDNRDVFDEVAFKTRFENKNIKALREKASVSERKGRNVKSDFNQQKR